MLYVVVMFEPARPGESLSLSQQVNEVFGPFEGTAADDGAADSWSARAVEIYGENREFLIIPLSDPRALDALEARRAAPWN